MMLLGDFLKVLQLALELLEIDQIDFIIHGIVASRPLDLYCGYAPGAAADFQSAADRQEDGLHIRL